MHSKQSCIHVKTAFNIYKLNIVKRGFTEPKANNTSQDQNIEQH